MNRTKWEFPYHANDLAAAAINKSKHHKERQEWWETKKAEIVEKIKAEGLEIDESLAGEEFSKLGNYGRSTTVQIRDDLLRDLQECVGKVKEHRTKIEGYDAWTQVLSSQGSTVFNLNQEDWLYFFGK